MHLGILPPSCTHRLLRPPPPAPSALPVFPPARRRCRDAPVRPVPRVSSAQSSTGGSDVFPDAAQKRAEITANVDRAAQVVGEIVDEVSREMFVTEAVAYLQEDKDGEQTELQAIKMAVMRRLEFLDANFLTALGGFIRACSSRGDEQLASMLTNVREEVLRQVSSRMPGAAQVLDLALRHVDKDARVGVVRTALSGGADDIPSADIDTLSATASKFIDEMEEQPEVVDRKLLARLVLLREELRNLREERRFNDADQAPEPVRANVPQRCAAFLRELVAVTDPLKRLGLLSKAFEQDWDGAAPRQKPQTAFHAGQPDWVRPGRFMATLQSTVVHLAEPDAAANAPVIARLEQIRSEAMVVLDRMHGGTARPEDLQQGAVEAVEAAGAGEEPGEGQEQEQEEEWVTVVSSAAGRSEKARAEEEAMAQAKRAMGLGPGDVVEAVEAEIGPDGVVRRVGGGEGEGL